MNTQIKVTGAILNRLVNLAGQFSNSEYTNPLKVLSGNSIGKHLRHVIEFYECLINGYDEGKVDYDLRERNRSYEENVTAAVEAMGKISEFICGADDKPLTLYSTYDENSLPIASATSFNRELIYNIEHAIHHMAIIKIAVKEAFPAVQLPEDFGVAYSTMQHLKEQCAQ